MAGADVITAGTAFADPDDADQGGVTVLNFALNLEYLEYEFYLRAIGKSLDDDEIGGAGKLGEVVGGHEVKFESKLARQYAEEIAADERAHVSFLRTALGDAAVARPAIDLQEAFTARRAGRGSDRRRADVRPVRRREQLPARRVHLRGRGRHRVQGRRAAGVEQDLPPGGRGHPRGRGLPRRPDPHRPAGQGLEDPAGAISDARDSLDGETDLDQGIVDSDGDANIVPSDENGIAFSRSAGQVLNIVYLTPEEADSGGFFPNGVNGPIHTSADNA